MTTPNPGSKIEGNGSEDSAALRPERDGVGQDSVSSAADIAMTLPRESVAIPFIQGEDFWKGDPDVYRMALAEIRSAVIVALDLDGKTALATADAPPAPADLHTGPKADKPTSADHPLLTSEGWQTIDSAPSDQWINVAMPYKRESPDQVPTFSVMTTILHKRRHDELVKAWGFTHWMPLPKPPANPAPPHSTKEQK